MLRQWCRRGRFNLQPYFRGINDRLTTENAHRPPPDSAAASRARRPSAPLKAHRPTLVLGLVPHAAMKFLLPLARANRQRAIALAAAIAPLCPSTRQTEALCVAFARGNDEARQYLLAHPELFLRARETGGESLPIGDGELLARDLGALGGIARRAHGRVATGAVRELLPPEQDELRRRALATRGDVEHLFEKLEQEIEDAGRAHQDDHSQTA